jgi:hypothetical protein
MPFLSMLLPAALLSALVTMALMRKASSSPVLTLKSPVMRR